MRRALMPHLPRHGRGRAAWRAAAVGKAGEVRRSAADGSAAADGMPGRQAAGGERCRNVGVADIDDRLVVDEVQLLHGGRVDLAVEDLFEPGVEFLVHGDGTVQDHCLVAVGRQDPWVVAHEHHQQDHGHQRQRQPHGVDSEAGDQAKGQG